MFNLIKKPIVTGPGWPPQKGMSEFEVRELLDREFIELARGARATIAAHHDLWRYQFRRFIELEAEVEKLEARLHKIEEKE